MKDKTTRSPGKTAQELRELLDSDPQEEAIHQFFKDKIFRVGQGNPRFSERFIMGAASKFPVTPDRIPDFTVAALNVRRSQTPGRVTFVELKRPGSTLYASHARMSKDLNDAWMECVETSRLMAENFRDCLRRLVKTLDKTRLNEFDVVYKELEEQREESQAHRDFLMDMLMPWCNSAIVIGRRSMLDAEGLLRTRELSASTGRAIQVITYDTVLDWVAEADEDDYRGPWSLFMRGWYW